MFINDKMAIRLFGSPNKAFGKTIAQVYGNSLKEIKIAGVFKEQPQNSSFHPREAFMNFVALMLSTTGLFTLVSLNIIRRTKEIGVRKVLGASVTNITRIINTEFFVILLLASLVGSVLSYFVADLLMARLWRYSQPTTTQTFIVSITIMFVISAVVVSYKVFTAASLNPVNTLRDE